MSGGSRKRDFLRVADLSGAELETLFERAVRLKAGDDSGRPLVGQTLAMIFLKSSTRTRVSFEVGMYELGGHALFLAAQDTQLARGESLRDTAAVLSRYVDGIVMRAFAHQDLVELAAHATVPVINALTDLFHPCQALADLLTVREEFGPDLRTRRIAWIGDGNNVANSWMDAALRLEFELRLTCPAQYGPDPTLLAQAVKQGNVELFRDPRDAVRGAHVVTTDVWTSMGQEQEAAARARAFQGYRVDEHLMSLADPAAIFLHCLPAHRGEEVTSGVIDGPRSRVYDEAENRLHVQKALILALMAGESGGDP
ncbi:MAG: ornithine carbamoyltransferase [Gemmatimonadetes bacterium]|nr:ornithine carbamoyltransferase [Gemmatimonadota bacterium]